MTTTTLKHLRLRQLDKALSPLRQFRVPPRPKRGWTRALRMAFGLSARQMAKRLNVSHPSYLKAEASEARETITLGQLRRMASALDCELVYAIVPRRSLVGAVEARAAAIAKERVTRVAHTMALEDQATSPDATDAQIESAKNQLLAGRWSRLWE